MMRLPFARIQHPAAGRDACRVRCQAPPRDTVGPLRWILLRPSWAACLSASTYSRVHTVWLALSPGEEADDAVCC
jgi:hypothetical protein